MKYRFLGYPDKYYPKLEHGKIYTLEVVTGFLNKKPKIIQPFCVFYKSWKAFYQKWRPMTLETMRLEGIDNKTK